MAERLKVGNKRRVQLYPLKLVFVKNAFVDIIGFVYVGKKRVQIKFSTILKFMM